MNKSISYILILIAILNQLHGQGGGQGNGDMVILEIPFTHTDVLNGETDNWNFVPYVANVFGQSEDYAFTLNVVDTITIDISLCNPTTNFDTMLGVFRKTPDSTYVDTNLECLFPHAADEGGNSLTDCFA